MTDPLDVTGALPEMILIPAGKFLMGSDPQKDQHWHVSEHPQHRLYLPDYYVARTPVTNDQYLAFVRATGHRTPVHWEERKPPRGYEHHPVVLVSWYDATDFCSWLAGSTGKPYRLPSEAEWEKAARGTDGRIFPWGNKWDLACCNTWETRRKSTAAVGAYPHGASPYGLLDMAGNVWEWTTSLWGEEWSEPRFTYPYDPNDGRENRNAPDSVARVLRGGCWDSTMSYARCATRSRFYPGAFDIDLGFRCATEGPPL